MGQRTGEDGDVCMMNPRGNRYDTGVYTTEAIANTTDESILISFGRWRVDAATRYRLRLVRFDLHHLWQRDMQTWEGLDEGQVGFELSKHPCRFAPNTGDDHLGADGSSQPGRPFRRNHRSRTRYRHCFQ